MARDSSWRYEELLHTLFNAGSSQYQLALVNFTSHVQISVAFFSFRLNPEGKMPDAAMTLLFYVSQPLLLARFKNSSYSARNPNRRIFAFSTICRFFLWFPTLRLSSYFLHISYPCCPHATIFLFFLPTFETNRPFSLRHTGARLRPSTRVYVYSFMFIDTYIVKSLRTTYNLSSCA